MSILSGFKLARLLVATLPARLKSLSLAVLVALAESIFFANRLSIGYCSPFNFQKSRTSTHLVIIRLPALK
jgi:hypothetical protein